jgi:hypothetical protein
VGFILIVDNNPEIKERWHVAGNVILWVVFYFWAVWVFDALLPARSEQTPFETYLEGQAQGYTSGGASAQSQTPEAKDLAKQLSAEGIQR